MMSNDYINELIRMDDQGILDPKQTISRLQAPDVFFPNRCHVCRWFGKDTIQLKRCSGCHLISYCSVEHQRQNWPDHREFCGAIQQIRKGRKIENLFETLSKYTKRNKPTSLLEEHENLSNRCSELFGKLFLEIMQKLKRRLKPFEEDMLIFSRFCAICFETTPEDLTSCKKCPQHSFCKKHLDNNSSNFQEECLKFLYIVAAPKLLEIRKESSWILDAAYFPHQERAVKLPSSTLHFLETYFPILLAVSDKFSEERKLVMLSFLTDKFSRPLTLLLTLEKLGLNPSSILIHVIGATSDELASGDWESMLHYLPDLNELRLVFIGPELISSSISKLDLCEHCNKLAKKIILESKKTTYQAYFQQNDFRRPDLIAGFNVGFHVYSSWMKCFEIFGKVNRPLMITCYTKDEAFNDKKIIKFNFPKAKHAYFEKNPFDSMVYLRNVLNIVSTKNNYIIIYKDLGPAKK